MTKPIPAWRKAEDAALKAEERALEAGERPTQRVTNTIEIAELLVGMRRVFKLRQEEVARRACVSRQWLVGFEQAKPTCEIGLVLRLLEVMGLEIELKPYDPMPTWLLRAKVDAQARAAETQRKKQMRRRSKREVQRELRMSRNAPRVLTDLD